MSKDQTIGALILIVCAIVIVGYVTGLFLYPTCIQPWLNLGANADVQFWLVAIPVLIGFVGILAIGAWIGYTMATTPPPKPTEEITAENKTEETQKALARDMPHRTSPHDWQEVSRRLGWLTWEDFKTVNNNCCRWL